MGVATSGDGASPGPAQDPGPFSPDEIRAQLARILEGSALGGSPRLQALLSFLVEETLAGRRNRLKGYTIGVEVLGRAPGFDPRLDPLVSIQAGRLRRALDRHYQQEGVGDPIRIEIPRGGFVPAFHAALATRPGAPRGVTELRRSGIPSIAVLPFADRSQAPGHSAFALGLTDELSHALTRFDDLRVVSPQSTMRYRDGPADVRTVGRELGARYVLAGSARREASEVQVKAMLIESDSGRVAWGDRYRFDLGAAGIFEVQDRITESVVSRIAGSFGVIPRERGFPFLGRRPEELDTYDAIQLVQYCALEPGPESYLRAREALERAVVREPDHGVAWAILGGLHGDMYALGIPTGVEKPLDHALDLVSRGLALDPECQRVQRNLAEVHFHRREIVQALEAFERTIRLNPNNATVVGGAGWAMALCGRWERGLDVLARSIRLNPYHPSYFFFAFYLERCLAGDFASALSYARQIRLPLLQWDRLPEIAALACLGRLEEAKRMVREVLARWPDLPQCGRGLLRHYVFVDGLDELLIGALREAGLPLE